MAPDASAQGGSTPAAQIPLYFSNSPGNGAPGISIAPQPAAQYPASGVASAHQPPPPSNAKAAHPLIAVPGHSQGSGHASYPAGYPGAPARGLPAPARSAIALITLVLGLLFWLVLVAGIASSFDAFVANTGRDTLFSFSWFLMVAQLAILVTAAILFFTGNAQSGAPTFVPLLTIVTAWLGVEADVGLAVARQADNSGFESKANTWATGFMLCVIIDLILLFLFTIPQLRPGALIAGFKGNKNTSAQGAQPHIQVV